VTTWNPSDKSADITLSAANLTATRSAVVSAYANARGTTSKTSGKYVWKFTCNTVGANPQNRGEGVALAAASLSNYGGVDTNSILYYADGTVYYNNSLQATWATYTTGSVVYLAWDADNKRFSGKVGAGNWNNNVANDPATGFASAANITTGFPLICLYDLNSQDTVDFTASGLSIPSGFSAWDAAAAGPVGKLLRVNQALVRASYW